MKLYLSNITYSVSRTGHEIKNLRGDVLETLPARRNCYIRLATFRLITGIVQRDLPYIEIDSATFELSKLDKHCNLVFDDICIRGFRMEGELDYYFEKDLVADISICDGESNYSIISDNATLVK